MIFRSLMIKNSPLASCASVFYIHIFYAHDILGYFCILKRVCQLLPFSHTQEGEPGSRVFVTRYYGFPILNPTHIRRPSLLLYDLLSPPYSAPFLSSASLCLWLLVVQYNKSNPLQMFGHSVNSMSHTKSSSSRPSVQSCLSDAGH
jgi:hypothetical protein